MKNVNVTILKNAIAEELQNDFDMDFQNYMDRLDILEDAYINDPMIEFEYWKFQNFKKDVKKWKKI